MSIGTMTSTARRTRNIGRKISFGDGLERPTSVIDDDDDEDGWYRLGILLSLDVAVVIRIRRRILVVRGSIQ
jgi:hypothetical protein